MVSVRLSAVLLAAAFIAAAHAPVADASGPSSTIVSRTTHAVDIASDLMKRVPASRPYSPELFLRGELVEEDDDQQSEFEEIVKRALDDVSDSSLAQRSPSKWSSLLKRREQSEEELHERGLVAGEEIESRGYCNSDRQCGSSHYCSKKRNRCYKLIKNWQKCSRDGACGSGYCCQTSAKCEPPRKIGASCHGKNNACKSDYCSVVTDKCRAQSGKGGSCRVDAGCKGQLSCVNGSCKHSSSHHHPSKPHPQKPHHPDHPSPSGSPHHPRSLLSNNVSA